MPWVDADAVRLAAELECCGQIVKLYEDGDMQDDGSILWSGLAAGTCKTCGQSYADWWEGTSKIGEPTLPPNGSSGADR